MDEQVVSSDRGVAVAARSGGERVEDRPDAERRKNMRRDLQAEVATDPPGVVGALRAEIETSPPMIIWTSWSLEEKNCFLMRGASNGY